MEKFEKKEMPIEEELYFIVKAIISHLDIIDAKELEINFKESIMKLASLTPDYPNDDINNFVYFLQHLFLNDEKNFEFDLTPIYKIIEAKDIKEIFECLMNDILLKKFFGFLNDIGNIFVKIYFDYKDMGEITKNFGHKKLTNFEVIIKILSLGKKNNTKLIYGNYGELYSIEYINAISTNLKFAININSKFITYKNYKEILNRSINNLFFKKISNEKEQLIEIENFIAKSINVYWVNSIFFFEEDYEDFFNILYNFVTDNNNKKLSDYIIGKNKIDNFLKKYLEFTSEELFKLFEDFEEASLRNFERNLYKFIIDYLDTNGTNDCINLILNIQMNNNKLSEEELGLITMICLNKNFINDMKAKISNKINIDDISEQLGLNEYEKIVLFQLDDSEKKIVKKEKKVSGKNKRNRKNKRNKNKLNIFSNESNIIPNSKPDILSSEKAKSNINNDANDSNIQINVKSKENNEIIGYNKNELYSNNIKIKEILVDEEKIGISNIEKENKRKEDNIKDHPKEKDSYVEICNFEISSNINEKDIIINNNEESFKTVSDGNNITNAGTKEISTETNVNLNPQLEEMAKTLNTFKAQLITLQKVFDEYKIENEKYKRENDEYKIKNEKYKRENDEYKIENEKYRRENEKYKRENDQYKIENEKYKIENEQYKKENHLYKIKVDALKEELEDLKKIHKSIYFRDVSKFYITKFSEKCKDTQGNTSKEVIKNQHY